MEAMLIFLSLSSALARPDPAALRTVMADPSRWKEAGSRETTVGTVEMRHIEMESVDCLEASAISKHSMERLLAIAIDVEANTEWTSAALVFSKALSKGGSHTDYLQLLDTPVPIADRYWYLRGEVYVEDGGQGFRWTGIDGALLYPEAHAELLAKNGDAVPLAFNIGSWAFFPHPDGTLARFRSCSDVGGKVPRWMAEALAGVMLPNNLEDLLTHANQQERSLPTK